MESKSIFGKMRADVGDFDWCHLDQLKISNQQDMVIMRDTRSFNFGSCRLLGFVEGMGFCRDGEYLSVWYMIGDVQEIISKLSRFIERCIRMPEKIKVIVMKQGEKPPLAG